MPRSSHPPRVVGIFETLAVVKGEPRLLGRHLARAAEGCRRLGLTTPSEPRLAQHICEQAALAGTGVVKLSVARSAADASELPRWNVRAEPPRQRPDAWARDGVQVIRCRTRLPLAPALAGLKLLDRDRQVLARSEWTDDSIAEGLMLDYDGRLISGTMTNVYAVIGGVIVTPALARCGVAGVMRAALIDAWQAAGQAVAIRDMAPDELTAASEIFLSNALIGVWPVRALDGQGLTVGPVARAAGAAIRGGIQ